MCKTDINESVLLFSSVFPFCILCHAGRKIQVAVVRSSGGNQIAESAGGLDMIVAPMDV